MRQVQAIDARHRLAIIGRGLVFEFRNHAFAAAGIAGDAVYGDGEIRWHQTGAHQWPYDGQKAGRPAAGIAHPLGGRDAVIAVHFQFRETIGPARRDTMSTGGVDHPHSGIVDQGDGLLRRLIGQTQDHQVGIVQRGFACRRILAVGIGQGDQRKFAAARQTLADFQPGGAGGAVDEDFCLLAHLVASEH